MPYQFLKVKIKNLNVPRFMKIFEIFENITFL